MFICISCLFVSVVFISNSKAQRICNDQEACIPLNECPSLLTLLKNDQNNRDTLRFVASFSCAPPNGLKSPVCCNLNKNTTTSSILRTSSEQQQLESVLCRTPDNTLGLCTSINMCETYIRNKGTRMIPLMNIQTQCGVKNRTPLFCCPVLLENERCGIDMNMNNVPKIVSGYGRRTPLEMHPWMALLKYNDDRFHCGGVLISKRIVLTAAHCIVGKLVESKYGSVKIVRLGETNLDSEIDCDSDLCNDPPQDIPVDKVIPHPKWSNINRDYHNDIGLLRLEHDAMLTGFVRTICLPEKNLILTNRQSLYAAGWGTTEIDALNLSKYKMEVHVPSVNRTSCSSLYSRHLTLHEGQFCAGGGDDRQDVCTGDSGGPLMSLQRNAWYSVGIVSIGLRRCGTIGVPSLYTNVTYYMPWIIETMVGLEN